MKLRTVLDTILPFTPIPCNIPNKDTFPNVLDIKSNLVIYASLFNGLFDDLFLHEIGDKANSVNNNEEIKFVF